jgi:hypothetical protein
MFSDSAVASAAVLSGVPLLTSAFERSAAAPLSPPPLRGKGKRKNTGNTGGASKTAATHSTAKKKGPPLRLSQLSKAEYAGNVGAKLAADVPDDEKEARVLEARDYRGIHLYADPCTGVVYNPDDIMAGVIDPRPLDPDLVQRLGTWVPSTGLRVAAAAAAALDDDADD